MPSAEYPQPYVAPNQSQPDAGTDGGATIPLRAGRYGELYVQNFTAGKLYSAADEGAYYTVVNPTPGTGIAGHAAPTDITVVTKPFVLLRNAASTSDNRRVFLDFIRLQTTAAGANGTNLLWALELDTGATRYSSGSTSVTPASSNMQVTSASSVTAYVGATTASGASSSARKFGSGNLRTVITVVGDTYLWTFGDSQKDASSMIVAGTAIANIKVAMPPVVLGPTDQILLHLASASQTGASSYEVTIGWYER